MNQIHKQHELTINISANSRTNLITNTTFFTMDVETGKKIINFTRDQEAIDLTNAKVLLGFEFVATETSKIIDSTDGSLTITNPEAGQCEVMLPNHFYSYTGQVLIHVYIIFEDGRSLDAGVIVTEFEESWLDRELDEMTDFYVRRFEDLAREIRERAEAIRGELESEFDDIREEIVETKREIREFVEDKGQAMIEAKGEIRAFVAEKEQAMADAKDEIRDFVTEKEQAMANAKNEIKDFVAEKERVVAQGKDELRNFVDDTKSELNDFKVEHKNSITNITTNTKETINGFMTTIKEKVSQSIDETKNELDEFSQAQKASVAEAISETKESLSEFNANLEEEVRTLIAKLQQQVRDNIILQETEFANLSEEIRQKLREKLEDLNTAAELKRVLKELMIEVQDQFEDDIENILHLASEIRAEMEANEAAVHDFNEHIENEEIHMTPAERERWEGQFANLESEMNTRAPMNHTHSADAINTGTLNPARIPTGTTATTVALGNHTHTAAQIGALPHTDATLATRLTITGDAPSIRSNAGTSTRNVMTVHPGTTSGDALLLQAGGLTIIGAGESATALHGALGLANQVEQMYVASDEDMHFVTNCQTVANRRTVTLNRNADLSGLHDVTATHFIGALNGNATTASTLQTARNINGTSFNGSANITTANWGTARTVALSGAVTGSASVNGSANVTIATTQANLATAAPVAPGTAAVGTSALVARQDHRHPLQTTVTGNAGTATTLATARNINGTSFNGSAAITTANWGTARNITIGSTTRSVNGSGNVTWTLADIGAAPASAAMTIGAWINLPLVTGGIFPSGHTPQYRQIGQMIFLRGRINAGISGSIGTLPSGFRPTRDISFPISSVDTNTVSNRIEIRSNGSVFRFGTSGVVIIDCIFLNS